MALSSTHFFPFLRMIRAMKLKEQLKELVKLFQSGGSANFTNEQGIELVWDVFIEKLPNAENEVFDFLAKYTGKEREEIEALPIWDHEGGDSLFGCFKQLLAEPQLANFLSQASRLTPQ